MSELRPRTTSVVVYQGDDLERLGELRRKAEIARRHAEVESGGLARMGDEKPTASEVSDAQDAYDAAVDEAADRAFIFTLEAMARASFRSLMAEHPPRDKNAEDEEWGVNFDTFGEAFLNESVVRVEVGDKELGASRVKDLIGKLPDGDFDRIFGAAYMLNRAPGGDPKESRYSTGSLS